MQRPKLPTKSHFMEHRSAPKAGTQTNRGTKVRAWDGLRCVDKLKKTNKCPCNNGHNCSEDCQNTKERKELRLVAYRNRKRASTMSIVATTLAAAKRNLLLSSKTHPLGQHAHQPQTGCPQPSFSSVTMSNASREHLA